ncbi:hypothetical protein GCM10020254_57860 [Streptomyces goshikiensis]
MIRHVGLVPQDPRDLLYADTVGAECAAADSDAGRPAGTCRALVTALLPDVPDDTHPPATCPRASAWPSRWPWF